ncbi:MAG: 16S rRNA (cytosine(1402)-N(4))-methyltransferase RsmH [Mycoplasmataceae bacterium]|jgi:16S rRNA (cytosine1402-N4)-methyltransferase|nr:16S rRNA (cytosine(1402)-N(4))-methyltransferase RsmH [Mycoplasmataceae bacterium]
MDNTSSLHTPVLLVEVIQLMNIQPDEIYLDCTGGLGGHSQAILDRLSENGRLICIDQDQTAIAQLHKRFDHDKRVMIIHDNFTNILTIVRNLKLHQVSGILLDLGVSSPMFDDPQRGFSYHHEGRLDMRMNQNQKLDAQFIVNKYDAIQLNNIFKSYGEIYHGKGVANAIVEYRKHNLITTTTQLVDVIKGALPPIKLHMKKHPARNYFQALRIAVNDELQNLQKFLKNAFTLLKPQGRLAIITFHSLEDRIVKQAFVAKSTSQIPKEVPITSEVIDYRLITKHPVIATEQEIKTNRRARSAKLRVIERK